MTAVRKAVIPAAGLGTRFLPATKAQPKEMLAVVDKPAIQYVVEEAVQAGLTDILVVTGRTKRAVEDHFDRAVELEQHLEAAGKDGLVAEVRAISDLADLHYLRQGTPLGLGHAISIARMHVGREPFAVLLPDDLMTRRPVLPDMLAAAARHDASVVALQEMPPERISAYGVVAAEPVEGPLVRILDLVEKPPAAEAPSNLAIVGRYVLQPEIFDALGGVRPGRGGEIQITDAMAKLLAGQDIYGLVIDPEEAGHYDIGDKLGYLEATVDLALDRPDLGPGLRDHLASLARAGRLGPSV